MNEESVLATVLQQPPSDRLEFLKEACVGDDALFQRLRLRLAGNDETDLFGSHTQPFDYGAPAASTEGPAAGTIVVGRFKLLECLGEGGMGTVYVAEQTAPVRRKVAFKLIKPGMDSKSVLARFEVERQALALMDHPNIARVLDGGIIEGDSGSSQAASASHFCHGVHPGNPADASTAMHANSACASGSAVRPFARPFSTPTKRASSIAT